MLSLASSLVSAAALLAVAVITYFLNEKAKRANDWRNKKLEYYEAFFDALAQNVEGDATTKSHRAFARETNNLHLIASREVLLTLHAFRTHISISNTQRDISNERALLRNLCWQLGKI